MKDPDHPAICHILHQHGFEKAENFLFNALVKRKVHEKVHVSQERRSLNLRDGCERYSHYHTSRMSGLGVLISETKL